MAMTAENENANGEEEVLDQLLSPPAWSGHPDPWAPRLYLYWLNIRKKKKKGEGGEGGG